MTILGSALAGCLFLAAGCATPTLAQRQDAWRKHVTIQRATCLTGLADPAMPGEVRDWCELVLQ